MPEASARVSGAQLTFAIPYYRDTEYLRRALDSVRTQTLGAWRLVVCDDASPDPGAKRIVESYDDRRISYVRNPVNLGLAGNWNQCLEHTETDLVTLLHSDDELLPGYADAVVSAHRRHPEAVAVFSRATIIDREGRRAFSVPDLAKRFIAPRGHGDAEIAGEEGLARLLRGSFIFCPSLCYRRSALGEIRFDPRWKFVVDLDLLVQLLFAGKRLIGIPEVAYAYRRHRESETSRLTRGTERFEEERAIYEEIAATATRRGWSRAARTARRGSIIRLHLAFRVLEDLARGRAGAARAKAALLAGSLTDRSPESNQPAES